MLPAHAEPSTAANWHAIIQKGLAVSYSTATFWMALHAASVVLARAVRAVWIILERTQRTGSTIICTLLSLWLPLSACCCSAASADASCMAAADTVDIELLTKAATWSPRRLSNHTPRTLRRTLLSPTMHLHQHHHHTLAAPPLATG